VAKSSLSAAQIKRLVAALDGTSAVMLKYYLKYQNLTPGMNDTKEQVVARIFRYLDGGQLSADELLSAAIQFQEYNNKRFYLFNVTRPALRGVDVAALPRRVDELGSAAITQKPDKPTVSYSWTNGQMLRVSWAETHRFPTVDYEREKITIRPVTRIVVLNVELTTGFITLAYDTAGPLNPHGGHMGYFLHYVREAEKLLGTPFLQFQTGGALMKLEKSKIVRLPQGRSAFDDGAIDITSLGTDYRDMKSFSLVRDSVVAKEKGRYIWLASGSPAKKPDAALPGLSVQLERDIPTDIHSRTSMIRFTKDCLEDEVEYVIAQIRAHA
jgi:hypothetical protein